MDINIGNILEQVKLPCTEEYMDTVIREFIKMSLESEKYIPQFPEHFDISKAFYYYLKMDESNSGPNTSKEQYILNEKVENEAKVHNTYVPLDGYKSPIINNQLSWYSYQSWHLCNDKRFRKDDIDHRFYINVNSKVIPQLTEKLYDAFKEKNSPFYFKVSMDNFKGFKDNIVIYSSTEEINNVLDVLKKIERENPDLIKECKEPHIFTAPIFSWVGYATEAKTVKDSYTNMMSRIITNALVKGVNEWILKNPNYVIKDNDSGQTVKVGEYLNEDLYEGKPLVELKKGYMKYIDHLGELLCSINKVDKNFKPSIYSSIRDELLSNGVGIDNICINEDVKRKIMDYNNKNLYSNYMQYDFSFEGLQKTFDDYALEVYGNDYVVRDLRTNAISRDRLLVDRCKFAYTWVKSTLVKTEGDVGYKYSFNEGAKEVYNAIMKESSKQMLSKGYIDMIEIFNNVNVNYEYKNTIIQRIGCKDKYVESLENWTKYSLISSYGDFENVNSNNVSSAKSGSHNRR